MVLFTIDLDRGRSRLTTNVPSALVPLGSVEACHGYILVGLVCQGLERGVLLMDGCFPVVKGVSRVASVQKENSNAHHAKQVLAKHVGFEKFGVTLTNLRGR